MQLRPTPAKVGASPIHSGRGSNLLSGNVHTPPPRFWFTFDAGYRRLFQAEQALFARVIRYHLDGEDVVAVDPQRVLSVLA